MHVGHYRLRIASCLGREPPDVGLDPTARGGSPHLPIATPLPSLPSLPSPPSLPSSPFPGSFAVVRLGCPCWCGGGVLGRRGVEREGPSNRHLRPDPHLGLLDLGPPKQRFTGIHLKEFSKLYIPHSDSSRGPIRVLRQKAYKEHIMEGTLSSNDFANP